MQANARKLEVFTKLDPREAAARVAEAAAAGQTGWLDEFAENLDRYRASHALTRILDTWGLSQSQAAEIFGISRQAISKWLKRGAPADRAGSIADLSAATDLLVHFLKRDRIPAVVRRKAAACGNRSLLQLFESGDTQAVLAACRAMFRFEKAQS